MFNARLKVCSDGNDVITGGSMFQTLAAATGKARSLMVLCNDRGTCNNAVDEDHRRPHDSVSASLITTDKTLLIQCEKLGAEV